MNIEFTDAITVEGGENGENTIISVRSPFFNTVTLDVQSLSTGNFVVADLSKKQVNELIKMLEKAKEKLK